MINSRLAMIVVCAFTPVVQGTLVTFEFGGVIDTVSDPHNLLSGAVQPGDSFTGSYTFYSSTADMRPNMTALRKAHSFGLAAATFV